MAKGGKKEPTATKEPPAAQDAKPEERNEKGYHILSRTRVKFLKCFMQMAVQANLIQMNQCPNWKILSHSN